MWPVAGAVGMGCVAQGRRTRVCVLSGAEGGDCRPQEGGGCIHAAAEPAHFQNSEAQQPINTPIATERTGSQISGGGDSGDGLYGL